MRWMLLSMMLASSGATQEQVENEDSAQQKEAETPSPPMLRMSERVTVVGSKSTLPEIPGSAYILEPRELERQKQGFDDVHRILSRVPGVVIQEEEGFGLRPNVGMRGSGTERSSKITLMEDGVLIAPAPYAAPAAYYFPAAGRMESIEVRKGSSQIKFGPRTNGGVLNLNSTAVPYDFGLNVTAALGGHDSAKLHANVGDSHGPFSWLFETYQLQSRGFKQLDGGGGTGFVLRDYLGKVRLQTSPQTRVFQFLELKLGRGEQDADETYLGLTDEDFRADALRRYAASHLDNLTWEHEQVQVRHFFAVTNGIDVTTTVYRNDFRRSWYKLQSILGDSLSSIFEAPDDFSEHLRIARGGASSADSLRLRANNRTYRAQGVQTVVGFTAEAGSSKHDLELGVRYHADDEDRFQHEDGYRMLAGRMTATSLGLPGSQSNRIGEASAIALFLQDRFQWRQLGFLPGIRYERIELTRTDYALDDPDRSKPTSVGTNHVRVVIPGLGVTYDVGEAVQLFSGVHRGFSPPGPGSSEETRPEESVNYEAGIRHTRRSLSTDLVFFYNDYRNLLGADTLSSGGTGEGDLFNGGAARVVGVEAGLSYDLEEAVGGPLHLPLRVSYSYTNGEFRSSFESDFEPWGRVESGDELPYLPRHHVFAGVDIENERFRVGVTATFNDAMRTKPGSDPVPSLESTDSFLVLNAAAELTISGPLLLFVDVQNVFDANYVVARQPAGARPGLPRTVMAGLKLTVRH